MKKVMVVDDEKQILELTKKILENEGFKVLACENGFSCLERLKEEKVDLVLMDYFMPDMDGIEVIEKIRGDLEKKKLKIALYTVARYSEFNDEELKKLNIVDFIQKPFNIGDLITRVENALSK